MDSQRALHLWVSLGTVHLLHLHFVGELLLLSIVALRHILSLVHKGFHGLLTLRSLWLELVQRVIQHLPVVREELAELLQVKLHYAVLIQKLADHLEDVC